jgi:hypothetical protein
MSVRTDVGTVDELHASATKAVGLDDFGTDDDNYHEALGVLLESYAREAGFTELGSKMSRFFVRNALVARLLSEAAWKQYPQHADVAIERPIFVTGLPRTGTTVLHRLLSADPRHQGLELWWPNSRSRARRAKPGRRTPLSSSSTRSSPRRTTRTRTTPGCTT